MTDINKQKFLAELGKLLTFMYEEDRQTALEMYSEMFDQAEDGQALLHKLVSPTRQAVVIARTYNQRERRLQVSAQSRQDSYYDEADEVPAYVIAIEDIRRQVLGSQRRAEEQREQVSLFEPVAIAGEEAEEEAAEPVNEYEEAEAEQAVEEVRSAAQPAAPAAVKRDAFSGAATELWADEESPEEQSAEEEAGEDAAVVSVGESEDIVFTDAAPEQAEAYEEDYAGEEEAEELYTEAPARAPQRREESRRRRAARVEEMSLTERRARPLLLVLYTLIALPVGLVGGLVLIIPIVLSLALTVAAVWAGISAISTAFGGFAMFSDLMVVLGAGLVLLALGLLFMWLFVWFIGGVLAGFINAIIDLGGRLCYKEVEVE